MRLLQQKLQPMESQMLHQLVLLHLLLVLLSCSLMLMRRLRIPAVSVLLQQQAQPGSPDVLSAFTSKEVANNAASGPPRASVVDTLGQIVRFFHMVSEYPMFLHRVLKCLKVVSRAWGGLGSQNISGRRRAKQCKMHNMSAPYSLSLSIRKI